MPTVTIVVPVRNEARSVEATLRTLCTQDFPADDYEVIVADGLSTDGTVPAVRRLQAEFAHLSLVYNPGRFSSAGRNTAARHARGDYVVIVDGHCQVPDRDYLKTLVAAFEASGADSLGRPQPLDAPRPTRFQQAVSVARASRLGPQPGVGHFFRRGQVRPAAVDRGRLQARGVHQDRPVRPGVRRLRGRGV